MCGVLESSVRPTARPSESSAGLLDTNDASTDLVKERQQVSEGISVHSYGKLTPLYSPCEKKEERKLRETSDQVRLPAEFKHINKRRKRN